LAAKRVCIIPFFSHPFNYILIDPSTHRQHIIDKSGGGSAASNGKLSKSTTQLHYNRITPLPVATSNAPFEQTFRITVLLPKDQLYVARLGARVPLSKLLSLVCDNKQLDADKYEFRNPGKY